MKVEIGGVPAPVADEIAAAYRRCGGDGLPAAVLAAARDKGSALHGLFVWDDTEAAEKFRLVQAERLVRRVKVKVIREEVSQPIVVRAYVARRDVEDPPPPDPDDGDPQPGPGRYVAVETVVSDRQLEQLLEAAMRRDIEALKRKYSSHRAFARVWREMAPDGNAA